MAAAAALLLIVVSVAGAAGRTAPGREVGARQAARAKASAKALARVELAAACDALMKSAARSPFGWGWDSGGAAPASPEGGRRASSRRTVEIDCRVTAAAGLVLYLAGGELDSPKYRQAAVEAARALAAVQARSGQFPAEGTLGPKPSGKVQALLVADRRATCAALGLLLTVVDNSGGAGPGRANPGAKPDARLVGAATRAAYWLAGQQADAGGWPVGHPPGAAPKEARRLMRLDDGGYRDATFALLLAAEVLGKESLRQAAGRSVAQLLKLRIAEAGSPGRHLWAPAYTADGSPLEGVEELPYVIDSLASSYGMQTLLAARLVGGSAEPGGKVSLEAELRRAADAVSKLPRRGGDWDRWYDLFLREPESEAEPEVEPDGDAPQPSDDDEGGAAPPAPDGGSRIFDTGFEGDTGARGRFGLPDLVAAAGEVAARGAEEYRQELDAGLPLRRRLAATLAGLVDGGIASPLPATPEAAELLGSEQSSWPLPQGLPGRVGRAWLLVVRTAVE